MKKLLILLCSLLAIQGLAQDKNENVFNKMSIGVSAGHFGYDPGFMINYTTPAIFNRRFATRVEAGVRWHQAVIDEQQITAAYTGVQTGIIYLIKREDDVKIYTASSLVLLIPNKVFTNKEMTAGFNQSIGLDITIDQTQTRSVSYFIEWGMTFINARAEKEKYNPRYSHGFTPVTGFRYHF